MTTEPRPARVLVVGGGIAGLAAARALQLRRVECDVIERVAQWQHPGVGMYLPANSVRALDRLGLRAPVVERAREIVQQCFLDARGRLLLDADLPAVWGRTGPCLALEREDLHEVMREGIAVRRDMTLAALREDGPRVHADFADGSSDDYDHVLGADGVRSWVRKTEFGGGDPDFLGQVSWRFLVSGFPELSAWTAWLGHGRVFLAIPVTDGLVYCYADLDAMDPHDPSGDMAAMLPKLYADFADPVPSMLAAAVANGGPAYFSPIQEVVQEPWVRGRVALIGDAAHAMSPNMAEGAGMALEDALVVAETIASGRPLEAFEARRRQRVSFVRAQTRRRDHTRGLPPGIRNATLLLSGGRIFRGGYAPLRAEP